jgi:hypothetical protein
MDMTTSDDVSVVGTTIPEDKGRALYWNSFFKQIYLLSEDKFATSTGAFLVRNSRTCCSKDFLGRRLLVLFCLF